MGKLPAKLALPRIAPRTQLAVLAAVVAAVLLSLALIYFPRTARTLDSASGGAAQLWPVVGGGRIVPGGGTLNFIEDATNGEHFVASREFPRSRRTLIAVEAALETLDLSNLWLRVMSDRGSADILFGLGYAPQVQSFGHLWFNATASDAALHIQADRSAWQQSGTGFLLHRRLDLELSARFEILGKGTRYHVQLGEVHDGTVSYKDNGRPGFKITRSKISILDTGWGAANVASP